MVSTALINSIRSPGISRYVGGVFIYRQPHRWKYMDAKEIDTKSPYEELKVKLDPKSTKENPMKVNAYGDERTIACVCDDIHFMTLKKGPSVKCKCGYWFQLVEAKKFWEAS